MFAYLARPTRHEKAKAYSADLASRKIIESLIPGAPTLAILLFAFADSYTPRELSLCQNFPQSGYCDNK